MSANHLPSTEEINAAYEEGREAVILLFQTAMMTLAERIQNLEDQLAKNSRNSGKPPSSDGYDQAALRPKSLRKRSGRKSGGQPGHRGEMLKAVEKPGDCSSSRRSRRSPLSEVTPSSTANLGHYAALAAISANPKYRVAENKLLVNEIENEITC